MKKLSIFQIGLIGVFLLFSIIGTLIFSGILPGFRSAPGGAAGELVIWGAVPASVMQPIIEQSNKDYQNYFTLTYVEKVSSSFEREFVEALADRQAPDLLILPQELALSQTSRLAVFPEETLTIRQYQDTFIDAGSFFITDRGPVALPLLLDPLVLYYNRSILNEAGLAIVPKTWTDFREATRLNVPNPLTLLDERHNITRSAVALGETVNIPHSEDILALLLLQTGNQIIAPSGGGWRSELNGQLGYTVRPAVAALDLYTQFSNSSNLNYAWNRSLPAARTAFTRGQSAFYFGFASEYQGIRRESPHLAFDVALVPQRQLDEGPRLTLTRILAIAVVNGGDKTAAALSAAAALTAPQVVDTLSGRLFLPPARRDLLAERSVDPIMDVLKASAFIGKAWFDPHPLASKQIFDGMVESVTTGRLRSSEAVAEADRELAAALAKL